MKIFNQLILSTLFLCLASFPMMSKAQCGAGEVEITLELHTDAYGYESYWELVPGVNSCGSGTIASGGNTAQLNCNSGGAPYTATPGNGYGNAQTYTVNNICVAEGASLTLYHVDDYGDGGLEIGVFVNGYQIEYFEGSGAGNTFNFSADLPPAYDLEAYQIHTPYTYMQPGAVDIEVAFFNPGLNTITDLTVNYQVDNGAVQSSSVTGLSIANYETEEIEFPNPWVASNGVYELKIWADNLNGNADMNNQNDTVYRTVEVGPGLQNIIDSYLGLSSYQFEQLGSSSDGLDKPTDLDFHPVLSRKELWVINKKTEANGGSTTTYYNAGETNQTSETREDGNSWHFMSLPTGIAFGENENFANSTGVFDANHDGGTPFTGPALWSSDPTIYAQPSGGNGSHLDMLHESPECQGIAHEKGNAYWVFDGYSDDIVMYDFKEDHGPGNSYHSDAIVHRYADDEVAKDPSNKVVSHLVLDKETGWLYVVDHGNDRVFRIDINSGSVGGQPTYIGGEPLAEYRYITGYTQEDVVTTGLAKPSGIDIIENRMIVSDYETSDIIIYDISSMPAIELGRINTGASGIMGVKIGPEGRIWYVDYDGNKLYRIEGQGVGIEEARTLTSSLYPNPSNGSSVIISSPELGTIELEILDVAGKTVYASQFAQRIELNLNLNAGIYIVRLRHSGSGLSSEQRLIIN
jgi:hypothetical protein